MGRGGRPGETTSHLLRCSTLGGTRTTNLLIRSPAHGVFHMLHRCRFAGHGLGDTSRTAANGSRCYMNCYTTPSDFWSDAVGPSTRRGAAHRPQSFTARRVVEVAGAVAARAGSRPVEPERASAFA